MDGENNDIKSMQKKIRMASDLFDLAVKIKTHQLKKKNPDTTDSEIRQQVIESIEKGSR